MPLTLTWPPCGTLQARIDATPTSGTLVVVGCVYPLGATIDRAMTIVGGTIHVPASGKGLIVTADDVTIDGVVFQGPQGTVYNGNEMGVYVSATSAAKIDRLTIRNCSFDDFGYGGIYLRHVADLLVEDNTVRDVVYAGIMVLSCVTGTVRDNTVQRVGIFGSEENSGNSYGIAVSDAESPRSSDVVVDGNTVEDVPNWEAIDTHGGLRVTFSDNIARRSRRGITVTSSGLGAANDTVVTGNQLLDPISIPVDDQYAVVLVFSDNTQVTGNTITGWGTPATDRAYLRVSDTNTTISGNTVTP